MVLHIDLSSDYSVRTLTPPNVQPQYKLYIYNLDFYVVSSCNERFPKENFVMVEVTVSFAYVHNFSFFCFQNYSHKQKSSNLISFLSIVNRYGKYNNNLPGGKALKEHPCENALIYPKMLKPIVQSFVSTPHDSVWIQLSATVYIFQMCCCYSNTSIIDIKVKNIGHDSL